MTAEGRILTMKAGLLLSAFMVGAMLPRGVKSQTRARKNRIPAIAKQSGISIFND